MVLWGTCFHNLPHFYHLCYKTFLLAVFDALILKERETLYLCNFAKTL